MKEMRRNRGFTLIELLVVIAIIGLLSSTILASLNSARAKAKDTRRISDLKQIELALELYYEGNKAYPSSGGAWRSQCAGWGGHAASDVIPGITPTFISKFPADPDMSISGNTCCYIYLSDYLGSTNDYKLLAHNCPTLSYASQPNFTDPTRDSGGDACVVDGSGVWSWALYTPGAACW